VIAVIKQLFSSRQKFQHRHKNRIKVGQNEATSIIVFAGCAAWWRVGAASDEARRRQKRDAQEQIEALLDSGHSEAKEDTRKDLNM
jgi:hypothetical protein